MKNKFIKSTLILIIGGFFTKLLGLVIRIILTRLMGTTGIGLYSMISPTFLLLNSIAMLGLPTALNVLISSDKYNNKNLVFTSIVVSLSIDILIMLILILTYSYLSINLLNNPKLSLGILSIGFILPFITVSNCFRSYYFAKERMYPHVISNIIEDVIRLILIIIGVPFFLKKGIDFCIAFVLITNIFSELSSIIIFLILFPKFQCNKKDLKLNLKNIKELLKIGIPTTGSRLIGSIGYFLEPIIITYVLLNIGYSNSFIVTEYGVINGYVMQLVLLPSFFTLAISQALIPIVSKNYTRKNYNYIKKKMHQAIFFSLLIGIPATIIFELFPEFLLNLFFKTTKGVAYIRILAPICLFHYMQSPISSTLQAMKKAKLSLKGTLYGMILRTISLVFISYLNIGLWSLIIASCINILFVTFYDYIKVKQELKNIPYVKDVIC